jgi:hypothetical protein
VVGAFNDFFGKAPSWIPIGTKTMNTNSAINWKP